MSVDGQRLQDACILTAQGFQHHAYAAAPRLSVKCMFNGRAIYRVGRAWFAVDETGYLILNEDQAYEIEIGSPTRVQSFVVYFPKGWSEEVLGSLTRPEDKLLDDPEGPSECVHFFEKVSEHDGTVSPAIADLRREHASGLMTDALMEEKLRGLLARMVRAQRESFGGLRNIGAERASTRAELWRRLHRARDFIRARACGPLSISEMAKAACLSPYHFMRRFKDLFGVTPHGYLTRCRVERATFLLERTDLPVTEICFESGFESPGTFSTWFNRLTGESPRAWRSKLAGSKKSYRCGWDKLGA
jgi:AraC family transcriptional regulator